MNDVEPVSGKKLVVYGAVALVGGAAAACLLGRQFLQTMTHPPAHEPTTRPVLETRPTTRM